LRAHGQQLLPGLSDRAVVKARVLRGLLSEPPWPDEGDRRSGDCHDDGADGFRHWFGLVAAAQRRVLSCRSQRELPVVNHTRRRHD
jgi:hypothetical protein